MPWRGPSRVCPDACRRRSRALEVVRSLRLRAERKAARALARNVKGEGRQSELANPCCEGRSCAKTLARARSFRRLAPPAKFQPPKNTSVASSQTSVRQAARCRIPDDCLMRHGRLPEREIMTGIGPVAVRHRTRLRLILQAVTKNRR